MGSLPLYQEDFKVLCSFFARHFLCLWNLLLWATPWPLLTAAFRRYAGPPPKRTEGVPAKTAPSLTPPEPSALQPAAPFLADTSPEQVPTVPVSGAPDVWRPQAWCPYACTDLEELCQAVKEDGVHAPWTRSLLRGLQYNLNTPRDWRDAARTVLPDLLFLQWEALFRDECERRACRISQNQPGWDKALYRIEHWEAGLLPSEARFPPGCFDGVRLCALLAWERITPPTEAASAPTLSLYQEPSESLAEFIIRVRSSLERKIYDPAARSLLLRSIVWGGMFPGFRQVCVGLKDQDPNRWLVAIHDVNSRSCPPLATAQGFPDAQEKLEGGCCWRRESPNPRHNFRPLPNSQKPRTPCPRCQKGFHWRKDCWSKFHRNGTPLPF